LIFHSYEKHFRSLYTNIIITHILTCKIQFIDVDCLRPETTLNNIIIQFLNIYPFQPLHENYRYIGLPRIQNNKLNNLFSVLKFRFNEGKY